MRPRIFFDLETDRFAPGYMAPRPVVCSLIVNELELLPMWETESWRRIEEILDAAIAGEVTMVGHHPSFDMACLLANAPDVLSWGRKIFAAYEADDVEDTAVRQKLMDIHDGIYRSFWHDSAGAHKITYQLGDVVPRLLGRPLPKPQDVRTSYGELWKIPISEWPEEHRKYSLDDTIALKDVWEAQEALAAARPGALVDQHRQARASFALQLAANWGLICDPDAVDALETAAKAEVLRLGTILKAAGLLREKGTKNMAAARAMMEADCAARGVEPETTPTGGVRVDNDACAAAQHPALKAWAEYNKQQNIVAKDIPMLQQGCGQPIHTYFEECVESGRSSSSSPNVQNVKRSGGFRECFVPRPGHVFAACDYGKAELHSLAEVCRALFGRSALGEALRAGLDPHTEFAKVVTGKQEVSKEDRQKAKAANFGFPGGLGIETFRTFAKTDYGVELSEEETKALKEKWFETWPEVRDYLQWIGRTVASTGEPLTHLFSGRMRGGCGYTDGANGLFQGLTADYAKAALWNVAKEEYTDPESPLYGCRTVNFIHDEILVEAPDDPDLADAAARRLQEVMEKTAEPWTPHYPVKAEPVLMRRWSKAAKQRFDERGRLIP